MGTPVSPHEIALTHRMGGEYSSGLPMPVRPSHPVKDLLEFFRVLGSVDSGLLGAGWVDEHSYYYALQSRNLEVSIDHT
jgi:hypothetical protein